MALELAARVLEPRGHLIERGREVADLVVGAHRHRPRGLAGGVRDRADHRREQIDGPCQSQREEQTLHQREQQGHDADDAAAPKHALELLPELATVHDRDHPLRGVADRSERDDPRIVHAIDEIRRRSVEDRLGHRGTEALVEQVRSWWVAG